MKNFSLDLRKHAEKIINYEQANIIAPTTKERKTHRDQKVCNIRKRAFSSDDNGNIIKLRIIVIIAAHVVYSKKCKYQKK